VSLSENIRLPHLKRLQIHPKLLRISFFNIKTTAGAGRVVARACCCFKGYAILQ
jgi:hypothetical protein